MASETDKALEMLKRHTDLKIAAEWIKHRRNLSIDEHYDIHKRTPGTEPHAH